MKGTIKESKYLFDKEIGFNLYLDIKTGDSTGFAHCISNTNLIKTLLIKAGEKSWSWMNPLLLVGKEVDYDYEPSTNKCTLKTITLEEKFKVEFPY